MFKKSFWVAWGPILGLVLLFSACNTSATFPIPDKVVVNGYTADATRGSASFNLSALDANGQLITRGTVQAANVTNLSARDSRGNPISGATATATICGQIIAQQNLTAAVVLDATGSMSWNDPNRKRNEAAKAFVDRMTQGDLAGIASFDTSTRPTSGYYAIKIWQDFTGNTADLKGAIDNATFAGGGTNLWDAVYDAATWLGQRPAGAPNPCALVLTDGQENASRYASRNAAVQRAQSGGVKVFMVGLGDPNSLSFGDMQYVAAQTGGTFAAVSDPNALIQLFDRMFNAAKSSFCVEVVFRVNGNLPTSGTTFTGTLNVTIEGRLYSANFDVVF